MIRNLVACMVLSIGFLACSGTGPAEPAAATVDDVAQALAAGDMATRCLPGVFQPEDEPQCEAQSGVREFQIGQCHLKVGRKCTLVEVQDQLHCCCHLK